MKIDRTIDDLGRITDTVAWDAEEIDALDKAHSIVSDRLKEKNIEQTIWEKKHTEFLFQGILRFDGIAALLHFAEAAELASRKRRTQYVGYCDVITL